MLAWPGLAPSRGRECARQPCTEGVALCKRLAASTCLQGCLTWRGVAAGASVLAAAAAHPRARQRLRARRFLHVSRQAAPDPYLEMDAYNDPAAPCPELEPPEEDIPYDDPLGYYGLDAFGFDGFGGSGGVDTYVQGYNSLLTESAWLGDWEGALETIADMRNTGVTPDATSYHVALTACRRGGAGSKAVELLDEMWAKAKNPDPDSRCYSAAVAACRASAAAAAAAEEQLDEDADDRMTALVQEMRQWGAAPESVRFQGTPAMQWDREVRRYGCGNRSNLNWRGGFPLPLAPAHPCWLLPNQDEVALQVARDQAALRAAGWKILSCRPDVVERLLNKAFLRRHAENLGLSDMMPKHYDSAHEAIYPCVLKPAVGTYGKDTHVVRNAEDVLRFTGSPTMGSKWLLQELIPGKIEHSTTMLVIRGEIYDIIGIRYEYDREEYVWPDVKELSTQYHSLPEHHVAVFRKLLVDFSGICCVNHKLRPDGSMALYDVNPRIGGDLIFDVPKRRARALFEKLDALCS